MTDFVYFGFQTSSIDDQTNLRTQTYLGQSLSIHALFHREIEDKHRLVSAVDLPPGTILGTVPVEFHYCAPAMVQSHFFELYPETVYFEPLLSIFTLLFDNLDMSEICGNVPLAYNRVDGRLAGNGPSFRIFAVAWKYIPALETLTL